MKEIVRADLQEAAQAVAALANNEAALAAVADAAGALIAALRAGSRVFTAGNGGSMCDAIHLAEELSGRYRKNRKALPAMAFSDVGHLTCVANDFGYDQVFLRALEAHARAGDVFVGITTSGDSANIALAAEWARQHGVTVISLTGRAGSKLSRLADHDLCVPVGKYSDRVQELHIKLIHILVELVERDLFPENYR